MATSFDHQVREQQQLEDVIQRFLSQDYDASGVIRGIEQLVAEGFKPTDIILQEGSGSFSYTVEGEERIVTSHEIVYLLLARFKNLQNSDQVSKFIKLLRYVDDEIDDPRGSFKLQNTELLTHFSPITIHVLQNLSEAFEFMRKANYSPSSNSFASLINATVTILGEIRKNDLQDTFDAPEYGGQITRLKTALRELAFQLVPENQHGDIVGLEEDDPIFMESVEIISHMAEMGLKDIAVGMAIPKLLHHYYEEHAQNEDLVSTDSQEVNLMQKALYALVKQYVQPTVQAEYIKFINNYGLGITATLVCVILVNTVTENEDGPTLDLQSLRKFSDKARKMIYLIEGEGMPAKNLTRKFDFLNAITGDAVNMSLALEHLQPAPLTYDSNTGQVEYKLIENSAKEISVSGDLTLLLETLRQNTSSMCDILVQLPGDAVLHVKKNAGTFTKLAILPLNLNSNVIQTDKIVAELPAIFSNKSEILKSIVDTIGKFWAHTAETSTVQDSINGLLATRLNEEQQRQERAEITFSAERDTPVILESKAVTLPVFRLTQNEGQELEAAVIQLAESMEQALNRFKNQNITKTAIIYLETSQMCIIIEKESLSSDAVNYRVAPRYAREFFSYDLVNLNSVMDDGQANSDATIGNLKYKLPKRFNNDTWRNDAIEVAAKVASGNQNVLTAKNWQKPYGS